MTRCKGCGKESESVWKDQCADCATMNQSFAVLVRKDRKRATVDLQAAGAARRGAH